MTEREKIQLFEDRKIRSVWDEEKEKWFFSVVDVCWVLTDQPNLERARNYWKVLKTRLSKEGGQSVTNCNRLKLTAADGKNRVTDVADMEQMFRIIQSIPSKKAEPFKVWMAKVAHEGAEVAKSTRGDIEKRLGHSVVTSEKAIDYIQPVEELPFPKKRKKQK